TSSHLAGSKENPYGELERFQVDVEAVCPLMSWADLIKLDVEGHEREIICSTTADDWRNTDMMLEIGTALNGEFVFEHCRSLKLNMFAQKRGWTAVRTLAEMPASYRDGSLFISERETGPWV